MKRVPGRNLFFQPELDNGNVAIVTPRGEQVGIIWWRPSGKYTVEIEHLAIQGISAGVADFDELVQLAEKGLSGRIDMDQLRPLLRRAWLEFHQGK